jgi:polysaccharide export outer membrane protein
MTTMIALRKLGIPVVLALLVGLCLPHLAAGQSASTTPEDEFKMKRKPQKFSSLDALKEFESYAPPSYTYGEGDDITVEVFSHPELSGKHIVGPDGMITLPVVGNVRLADLSREEGRKLVEEAYARYYEGLSVVVRTEVYASNRIFVLGRVAHPGLLQFETVPTLLEAVTRAGSLPVGGVGGDKAAINRCVIFRGREAVVWVDLKPLFREGNQAYNIQLKRNDVIYLPDSDDQSIFVLGEVLRPGAYPLRSDMTFLEAFAEAGGETKDGVTEHVHLIRPSKNLNREISLRELMRPNASLNFALADGDIIYVPKRRLAKFGYVVQQFGPASGLAVVGKELAP